MEPFSKRNKIKKEYSGYGVASKNLRNRLSSLIGLPYSGDEYNFGVGNTDWIHEGAFYRDLKMHFGIDIPFENFIDEVKTSYDQVFDFIEIYYKRALQDLDYEKRRRLHYDICSAFDNSGSVYGFNLDGQVVLVIDDETAKDITEIDTLFKPLTEARDKFRSLIDGLIARSIDPADAVGDIYTPRQ